jgi:CheY-like chemotaxis protein
MFFRRKKTPTADSGRDSCTNVSQRKDNRPRLKILLADDDPVTVQALSVKLKSKGYDVVTASDGAEALMVTRLEKPNLMILDVNFPPDVAHGGAVSWNGFLLAQWFRRSQADHIPIIFISASNRPEYKKRAAAVGAAAFLPKTIVGDGLLGCISLALAKKCGGEEPEPAPAAQSPVSVSKALDFIDSSRAFPV